MSWQLGSFVVLAIALTGGFAWYERSKPPARVLALVAALAALAVVGRLAFAAIPNVKPTTDIVLLAGWALGPIPGFAVGAVTALASNVFLGQGPWTPWQMAAWGGIGIAGGLLGRAFLRREPGRFPLAGLCAAAGLAFGAVMDVYQWSYAADQTLAQYGVIAATSLPYNLAHAIGNGVFCLALGPAFLRAVGRYRRRFDVRWPAPAPAAAAALAAMLVVALGTSGPALAATPSDRAVRYLDRAQNADGGFGGGPRQSSTQLHSGWTALGLASAGVNPRDAKRGRRSVIDYLRAGSRRLNDTGDIERTILVLRAAGLSPRRFGRRDLVRELIRSRGRDGSWDDQVAFTAFGILALRAGGEPARSTAVRRAARYLERSQREDGGFPFAPGAASDVDDTGAVLQALAAAGRGRAPAVRRAVSYLRRAQNPDGGFGQLANRSSNAQSTAWAVQGLVAVRRDPAKLRRDPLRYLRSLQAPNGSVRYSRTSSQTPVWVTAQALLALERRPLPIRPVRRKRAARRSRAAPPAVAREPKERAERRAQEAGPGPEPPVAGADIASGRGEPLAPEAVTATPAALATPAGEERAEDSGSRTWLWLIAGAAGLAAIAVRAARRR
ncbi:MAG TPA: ECF transporter S component [Thermoleophilaceae bacterium]|nr:ECF transporter S component [Thermoleophilaceae bacterium]